DVAVSSGQCNIRGLVVWEGWSVVGSHASLEVRAQGLRMLLAGESAASAARALGVGAAELGIWARLVGMELVLGAVGGVRDRVSVLPASPAVGHGRRLSPMDRVRIEAGVAAGVTQAELARQLGVNRPGSRGGSDSPRG
ncbi:helix-turn-helix domain-containing protein, partial [Microbacterium arthrosphaerae]|uniref:helix-turn-helix domain-containing protein n=1 Tax=Microbacterium arthrosphaerae TaxID=792652 RepID=UPI0035EDF89A